MQSHYLLARGSNYSKNKVSYKLDLIINTCINRYECKEENRHWRVINMGNIVRAQVGSEKLFLYIYELGLIYGGKISPPIKVKTKFSMDKPHLFVVCTHISTYIIMISCTAVVKLITYGVCV